MHATFETFFRTATGGQTPYAYQRRLAGASEGPAPSGSFPYLAHLTTIHTGPGETATILRKSF